MITLTQAKNDILTLFLHKLFFYLILLEFIIIQTYSFSHLYIYTFVLILDYGSFRHFKSLYNSENTKRKCQMNRI